MSKSTIGILPPAVILSAGTNALGAARGLASVGVPVIAVAQSPHEIVLKSRYPQRKFFVPANREADRHQALLELLEGLHQQPKAVLIPTSDFFVSFLVENRDRLAPHFDFCIPPDDMARMLIDKSLETRTIADLGVPLPATVQQLPATPQELGAALRLPIIIKPRSFAEVKALGRKNVILTTPEEMVVFYQEHRERLGLYIAQEVIPGEDDTIWVCNCSFNQDGEMVEAFSFRRLRLAPAHFGVTSYAVSETNEDVYRWCRMLGKGLHYTGPAMIEFKLDERDGEYKYIELNPRIGLCNFFDTSCGINNVWHAYRLARGIHLQPTAVRQRDKVMYLELVEDFFCRWKDGENPAAIIGHYLRNASRSHVGAYFYWKDPWPAISMLMGERRRFRTLFRKLMGSSGNHSQ